jgi:hypothetical protein
MADLEKQKEFASRLMLMKEEAGRLGLYATMQRFDWPLRMVGFEMAGNTGACIRYEKDLEKAKP